MSLQELLPILRELPREDKLRAAQFLISEVAREEGVNLLENDADYPIWSPYDAFDAADTLLKVLREDSHNG